MGGRQVVFFDGPAGSQTPQRVIDAIGHYLANCNANHGGVFVTGRESDAMLEEAHRAVADFIGAQEPECVIFGANMTSLTFSLSRALSRSWGSGDRIIVTRLDHDANVTPWVMAARDAGATVEFIGLNSADCTLDLGQLSEKLSRPTRFVAVGCASNATGTVNPVAEICRQARAAGAQVFLDAVHYAPHARIDVDEFGCDFLACSAYKFFGPHVGVLWGRRDLLESIPAYKVEPASNVLPEKWMTGTQNHEGIAGTLAAVEYLADLGRTIVSMPTLPRRQALGAAYQHILEFERGLLVQMLQGLSEIPSVTVWGIRDSARLHERLPTISITHSKFDAKELAQKLADRGIFVWHGNYYALQLTRTLGLEPQGMVRIGMLHYNTAEEVERFVHELKSICK